jgi:AcrR family transcriptional regulator
MAVKHDVVPNRRGERSREAVLDAAERVMAERGYEAATVASLVEEAGVPASSIYHYFGSKEGVLLAVMERGAERFHEAHPAARFSVSASTSSGGIDSRGTRAPP